MKYLKDVMVYQTYNLELLEKYNFVFSRFLSYKDRFLNLYSRFYFLPNRLFNFFRKRFLFKRKSFNLQTGSDLKRIGLKIKNYYSRIF
ncbi:insulinase family protein, partial [Leptospira interrogans]